MSLWLSNVCQVPEVIEEVFAVLKEFGCTPMQHGIE